MAAEDTVFSNTDDASMIALLRRLRAGAAQLTFLHRIDVCAAAPENLVAGLDPVPGTDLADGGYNAVWLFYCPKRFKNVQGKTSGHRHRAIAGGDTCWHSETRPKPVKGLDGGATLCNLSYGRKEEGSGRSFNRMGWCMTEYDDIHDGGSDVLCKVYRSSSSLAKRKSKAAATTQGLSGSKRKAAADHAESPPATKMSHSACTGQEFFCVDQPHVQQQPPLISGHHQQMTMPGCVDYQTLFPEEQVQVQENNTLITEQPDQSLFTAQGEPDWEQILQFLSDDKTMFTNDELLQRKGEELIKEYELIISGCSCSPTPMAPPDIGFSQGLAF
ncbi:unnamed protein product [Urochloa humidicola]